MSGATHPSATRPVSASPRGLAAPSQIEMGCAGRGPGFRPLELVVAAFEAEPPLAAPERADDGDGLLERLEALAGGQRRGAHRLRRHQVAAGAETGLEAAAAQLVERRGRLREHRRWTQRQVADRLEDAHPLRAGEDEPEQRQACRGACAGRGGPEPRAGRSRGGRLAPRSRRRASGSLASGTRK